MSRPSQRLSTQLRRKPTRYEPLSRIAVGGMAEVWKARAHTGPATNYEVAIKRVLPNMGDERFMDMFEDEARLGMLLNHPNIVRVYDARHLGGTSIMVMELVDGASLKDILVPAQRSGRPFPTACALHITRELLQALEYVHDLRSNEGQPLGIIHRDVSPHNLLLSREGEVKLTDFGLADSATNQHGEEGMVGGKVAYLAPEVVRAQANDHRIDLFATGIMLWEMLAGKSLFQEKNDALTIQAVARCEIPSIEALNDRVPKGLDQILARLLAKDPGDRYRSAKAALGDFRAFLAGFDGGVGPRDVSLVVGLHLAQKKKKAKPDPIAKVAEMGVAELLANELDELVKGTGGSRPLDPREFRF